MSGSVYSSSLDALCARLGIRIKCVRTAGPAPEGWSDSRDVRCWKCQLSFQGRKLTTPFYQGSAHTEEPTAADVVSSLCLDGTSGEQSFEDFCGDLGYDEDSRKAERTWGQCAVMATKIRKFLGDHFDEVAQAEH